MNKTIRTFLQSILCIPAFLSAESSLSDSINDFAINFYQEALADSSKNELFSPFCLFSCLSMAHAGAHNTTADEMAGVLSLNMPQEELAYQLNLLSESLLPKAGSSSKATSFELNIANSLWLNEKFTILPSYQKTIQEEFKAHLESLDFRKAPQAVKTINQWISTQTSGKIDNLLKPQDLSPDSQLMLVSALYFKGSLARPFHVESTYDASFFNESFDETTVKMMNQTHKFPYYETDDFQLLLLPFSGENQAGGKLAAFFFLPKKSLSHLEQILSGQNISSWMDQTRLTKIDAHIPRFQEKIKYDLAKTLSSLGMPTAFSRNADFSKIDGTSGLSINKAVHEAFFALDEKGVTAAAATAIGIGYTCAMQKEDAPISFMANHPFLFGIVDLNSNIMLFLGKMTDPQ